MSNKAIQGKAGKAGYCDAIFNRAHDCQFTGHYDALKYDAGYRAGKESGVSFNIKAEPLESNAGEAKRRFIAPSMLATP